YDAGLFTWKDWAQTLGTELATDAPGAPCKPYYEHWLTAFEKLLAAKGLTSLADLGRLQDAWDKAARATPHGKPITLKS
ncbi:MAG: nitrile hydratase accessory protein, partial [Roseibium sp.]